MLRLETLIALAFTSRNGQPFYLTARDFFELRLPAVARPGDEE
jgi:hypothetical protein